MILVVGTTGVVGGMLVQQLLDQGNSVRILVRPQSTYQVFVEKGAQPVLGDLKDRASLDKACEGVEAILTTANSARRDGDDTIETVDIQGNRNLIDAAIAANVQRFIFTSALGADANSPVPFIRARGLTQAYLRDSGLDYTVLEATLILDLWLGLIIGLPLQTGKPVAIIGTGKRQHSFVAARDVAAFGVAALRNSAASGKTLHIGGPEVLSWLEIVAIARRVVGRELPVRHFAPGDAEAVAGLPSQVGAALDGMMSTLDGFNSPLDMTELVHTYGVQLTSAETLIRHMFVQA